MVPCWREDSSSLQSCGSTEELFWVKQDMEALSFCSVGELPLFSGEKSRCLLLLLPRLFFSDFLLGLGVGHLAATGSLEMSQICT